MRLAIVYTFMYDVVHKIRVSCMRSKILIRAHLHPRLPAQWSRETD